MNGLATRNRIRQRLILSDHLQREHNDLSDHGDRTVFIGAVIIAVLLIILVKTGVIA